MNSLRAWSASLSRRPPIGAGGLRQQLGDEGGELLALAGGQARAHAQEVLRAQRQAHAAGPGLDLRGDHGVEVDRGDIAAAAAQDEADAQAELTVGGGHHLHAAQGDLEVAEVEVDREVEVGHRHAHRGEAREREAEGLAEGRERDGDDQLSGVGGAAAVEEVLVLGVDLAARRGSAAADAAAHEERGEGEREERGEGAAAGHAGGAV